MLKLYAFDNNMNVIDYEEHKLIINNDTKRNKICL